MAAVQAVEDASRIPSHRMPGVRVQHLRELAQQTETRKEDRRAAVIRKAREDVGRHYQVASIIGEGGYGVVFSAVHRRTGARVAIKRVAPFEHHLLAVRTLRELRLLRYFHEHSGCENIIKLLDVVVPGDRFSYQDMYFVQEMMDTDLYRVVRTQALSHDHAQYFTYQILRGLKPIHAAGVLHRDIKPSNLLVNANCDLKICDFGLARSMARHTRRDLQLTEYVATRWYRAPEIMLSSRSYTKAVDIWSVGCTLFEMLTGEPLFPGKDHVHQFSIITELLGTPPEEVINTICSENTLRFVQSLPKRERVPFTQRFPHTDPEALDLLERMLVFDVNTRITAGDALTHPYLQPYHNPDDEPVADEVFDWSFNDADLPIDTWKVMMYSEILDFHNIEDAPSDAAPAQASGAAPALPEADPTQQAEAQQAHDAQFADLAP